MKFSPQSLLSTTLFDKPIDRLVPRHHPERIILDQKAFKQLKPSSPLLKKIYQQQLALYQGNKVTNRIVSFHNRPNIRPIFKGKAEQRTEFGPKVELSTVTAGSSLFKCA